MRRDLRPCQPRGHVPRRPHRRYRRGLRPDRPGDFSVLATRRCDLTEEQAQRDGFASLTELHQVLDMHYPGLEMEDNIDAVTFELSDTAECDSNSRG